MVGVTGLQKEAQCFFIEVNPSGLIRKGPSKLDQKWTQVIRWNDTLLAYFCYTNKSIRRSEYLQLISRMTILVTGGTKLLLVAWHISLAFKC